MKIFCILCFLFFGILYTNIYGEETSISIKSSLHSGKQSILYTDIDLSLYNISLNLFFTETQINPKIEGNFSYKFVLVQCGHRTSTFQSGMILSNRSFYFDYSPEGKILVPFGCSLFGNLPYFNLGILYYQYIPELFYNNSNNEKLHKLFPTLLLSASLEYKKSFFHIRLSTLYDITSLFDLIFHQKLTSFEWKKIVYSSEMMVKYDSFEIHLKNYFSIYYGTSPSASFILKKPFIVRLLFYMFFSNHLSPFSKQIFHVYKEYQRIDLQISNFFFKLRRYHLQPQDKQNMEQKSIEYSVRTFIQTKDLLIQYRYIKNNHQGYMQSFISLSKNFVLISGFGAQWNNPVVECILGVQGNILDSVSSYKVVSWKVLVFGIWYIKNTSTYISHFERFFILERKNRYEYIESNSVGFLASMSWRKISLESYARFQLQTNNNEVTKLKKTFSFHIYVQYQQKFQI